MNFKTTERVFALMHKYGVEHFKNFEIEVRLTPSKAYSEVKPAKEYSAPVPLAETPVVDPAIPHHVNEVANLLKLNDNDLVDKLFPLPPEEEPHA